MSFQVHPPQIVNGYELMGEIGRGATGTVRLAKRYQTNPDDALDNEVCCCKIIPKLTIVSEQDKKFFHNEISVLSKINHPNIVSFIELFEDQNNYYVFQEYCNGILLTNYITRKGRLQEGEAAKFLTQLLQALNYLHENSIAHRDIKLDNIMLVEDESNLSISAYHRQSSPNLLSRISRSSCNREQKSYKIKLIDFGLSTNQSQQLRETFCGSPLYAAPECLKSEPYNATKSDIWSAGVVFYIMVVGNFPWDPSNITKMINRIVNCDYRVPTSVSQQCLRVFQKMLVGDPNKRPSARQLLRDHDITLLMPVTVRQQPMRRPKLTTCQSDQFKRIPLAERRFSNPSLKDNNQQNPSSSILDEKTSNDSRRPQIPLAPINGTPRVMPPKIPLHKSKSFHNVHRRKVNFPDDHS